MTPRANNSSAGLPIDWFLMVALLAVVGLYVRAMGFTPPDAFQGLAQKILYIHPPAAVAAYLAFGVCALMSVLFLWLHDERSDVAAAAAGEVAVLFFSVVLVTGPLWGRKIWGAWWTWDARLTMSLFLWFIGIGYLVVRHTFDEESLRARYSAVLAILAVILIPFVHLSVYFFRTLHPMPVMLAPQLGGGDDPSLSPEMRRTAGLAFLTFVLLCVAFIRARYRLGALRAELAMAEEAAERR